MLTLSLSVASVNPLTKSSPTSFQSVITAMADADASAREKKEKEAKEKGIDEEPNQTLEQQETMKISGTNARHMVMQKLMRQSQVNMITVTLFNFISSFTVSIA